MEATESNCQYGSFVWRISVVLGAATPGQELEVHGHPRRTTFEDRMRAQVDMDFLDTTLRLCDGCDGWGKKLPVGYGTETCALSRLSPDMINKICEIAGKLGVKKEAMPTEWGSGRRGAPSLCAEPYIELPCLPPGSYPSMPLALGQVTTGRPMLPSERTS